MPVSCVMLLLPLPPPPSEETFNTPEDLFSFPLIPQDPIEEEETLDFRIDVRRDPQSTRQRTQELIISFMTNYTYLGYVRILPELNKDNHFLRSYTTTIPAYFLQISPMIMFDVLCFIRRGIVLQLIREEQNIFSVKDGYFSLLII
ncbi:MAG: hypothetical protein JW769_05270 [Parachlamydiales bacterium]|nr:hypothetical protein [Parachlamydiales bacterium]